MIEVERSYDETSKRTWIYRKCPQCDSRNLTPMGKGQSGIESQCYLLCEGCGHVSPELVVYALNGKQGVV